VSEAALVGSGGGGAVALPPEQAARPVRQTALIALVAALLGTILAIGVMGIFAVFGGDGGSGAGHRDGRVFTAPGKAFSVAVPTGWTALSGSALARVEGAPAAALRENEGRGLVLVHRVGTVHGDLRAMARRLTKQLSARVPGFKLVSARLGRVRAGGALLYTFVRGRQHTVQTLALTKVRGVTYRLDALVPAEAPDVARQAGAAIGSFGK
jgi:hypothetical protein